MEHRSSTEAAPKAWNWGAFFLTWIWGAYHGVWISLLALIPGVGLVMAFILGAKGNAWAWNNDKDKDATRFNARQRTWALWGLGIWGVGIVIIMVFLGLLIYSITTDVKDAQNVSLEFITHIRDGKSEAAYSLTDNNFKKAVTATTFTSSNLTVAKELGTCTPAAKTPSFASSARAKADGFAREASVTVTCGKKTYTVFAAKKAGSIWMVDDITDKTTSTTN